MRDHFIVWVVERLRSVGINAYFTNDPRCDWEFRAFIAPYGNVYFYCARNKVVWGAGNTERGVVEWLSNNVLKNCVTVVNPKAVPACVQYLAKHGYATTEYRIVQTDNLVFVALTGFTAVTDKLIFAVESFCSSRGYTYAVDDDQIVINVAEIKYEPEKS